MEKEKFICEYCGKEYKTKSALKTHITKMHNSKKNETLKKNAKQETKKYDDHDLVLVKNGTSGELVYIAPRTGVTYIFDSFGDEQEIPFGELKATRMGNYATFFKRQWFLIDDQEVIKQLGIEKYYKDQLSYNELNEIFNLNKEDIVKRVKNISEYQRDTLGYLTVKKIKNNEINDLNVIRSLEDVLHTKLI